MDTQVAWTERIDALWASIDDYDGDAFVTAMTALVAERPASDPDALYELGGAYDSTGDPERAVTLYEASLAAGITGPRRRRLVIQYASSLRNLGHAERAVGLLREELAREPDELTNAVRATLSLALVDAGREREAVSVALTALSEYLPRYNRSMRRYALALMETTAP